MGQTCLRCGATVAMDGWCPQCAMPSPDAPPALHRHVPTMEIETTVGKEFGASSVTFGLTGRIICTLIVILVPVPILWLGSLYTGWGFAGLWWIVVGRWAMRDIWRTGRRKVKISASR